MRLALPAATLVLLASSPALAGEATVSPSQWRVVDRDSGPDRYYASVRDPTLPFLRARYSPPMKTTTYAWQMPDAGRATARVLRWTWRVETFPAGGNECDSSRADNAAAVYATWKRGLRYYTIKYVWSTVAPRGTTCNSERNPFVAQDSVILESGGATGQWKAEEVDLPSEFRRHFEDGRPDASVPDFVGLGVLTDGDATHTESAADYAGFVVTY